MEDFELIKERFSNLAKQYPGLTHVMNVWHTGEDESELDPSYLPTEDKLISIWGNGLKGDHFPDKNVKHWLIKPEHFSWNKSHAAKNLECLAENAVQILIHKDLLGKLDLPDDLVKYSEDSLTSKQAAQLWVLVVLNLGNSRQYYLDWHDHKAIWENVTGFDKSDIELKHRYYEIQQDVFLESSLLVGRLIELEKSTQTELPQNKPLSKKALAVLKLLQSLDPNKALTGPEILEQLDKENIIISQSVLTKSIMPELKAKCGVRNTPRIGYYIEQK